MRGRADRPLRDRKVRDRALVLPLIGLVLFLVPVTGVVPAGASVGGVPLALAYVFLVWAGLVAGAAALSRRLARAGAEPASPGARDG